MSVSAVLLVATVSSLVTAQLICASVWWVLHYAEYRNRIAQTGGGQGCEACRLPRPSHVPEPRVPRPDAGGSGHGEASAERGSGPAPRAGDMAGTPRSGLALESSGSGLLGSLGTQA